MQAARIDSPLLKIEGIVQRVDDAAGELKVLVNDDLMAFKLPEGCTIFLGEEQVGLRGLQPLDHVRIAYAEESGVKAACSIQASWLPFSHAEEEELAAYI